MADFYVGQIITVGWNFATTGTALCNGQLMSISQNTALFSILGTTYGGDGQTTFALPNLQSRRMNHTGQGPGLSNYELGQESGAESVTLTQNNLPSHTHTITSSLSAASATKATLQIPGAGAVLGQSADVASGGTAHPGIYCPSGTATSAALGGLNVSAGLTGNSQPFSNISPYLTISMLIVLFGIFPSRN
jgi:microcystin-dependent protein